MKFFKTLVALGLVLSFGWIYLYALPTASLVQQMLNNEPYYVDIVPMYLLPYAIAPFVAAIYIEGNKQNSLKVTFLSKQWITFILLTFFALLQLFESLAFFFAFFSTFTTLEPKVEWLLLSVPIGFLAFFLVIVRFLFQTRHSLKSIEAA